MLAVIPNSMFIKVKSLSLSLVLQDLRYVLARLKHENDCSVKQLLTVVHTSILGDTFIKEYIPNKSFFLQKLHIS